MTFAERANVAGQGAATHLALRIPGRSSAARMTGYRKVS